MSTSLQKSWQDLGLDFQQTPAKSSLSEARSKVCHSFFKDIYEADLLRLNQARKTYRGFHIYAVDGDDLNLPCSNRILAEGYRGWCFNKNFETYYPKMYTVYAYDVMNGLVSGFKQSQRSEEFYSAIGLIPNFEKNSIAIYDRLYGSYPVMSAHAASGSYFLIRLKKSVDVVKSSSLDQEVEWRNSQNKEDAAVRVRIVKMYNAKIKEMMFFATNLTKEVFSRKEIVKLYQKRWEIETSLRDLTHTMKVEQWHSQTINGILQEIYALLWLMNNVKMQMRSDGEDADFLDKKKYYKSNFKLCMKIVIENISLLIVKKYAELKELLSYWINRSKEKRCRRSRSYPRIIKNRPTKYTVRSKIRRRGP
jgi:Transposase DDE domain